MIEKYKEIIEKLLRYRKKYKYNVEKLLRLLRYRKKYKYNVEKLLRLLRYRIITKII